MAVKKRRVGSRVYDPDTATLLGEWDNGAPGRDERIVEQLYKKYGENGEFFIVGSGGCNTHYGKQRGTGWESGTLIWPLTMEAGLTAAYCLGFPNFNGFYWRDSPANPLDVAWLQLTGDLDSWYEGWAIHMDFCRGGEEWSADRGEGAPYFPKADDIRQAGVVAAKDPRGRCRFECVWRTETGYELELRYARTASQAPRMVGRYPLDGTHYRNWCDFWENAAERTSDKERRCLG